MIPLYLKTSKSHGLFLPISVFSVATDKHRWEKKQYVTKITIRNVFQKKPTLFRKLIIKNPNKLNQNNVTTNVVPMTL